MNTRGKKCVWQVAAPDRARASELARELDVSPLIAHLLLLRGVENGEDGGRFLNPSLTHLSDPLLLTDMDRAVERIELARRRREHVLVFGDYDVDGITGVAVLINALERFGVTRRSYGLPDRLSEGYGLSPERVEWAHGQGVGLIITVDNGINAHDAAERAKQLGIDLIVTDHHQPGDKLPHALALINPQREDALHPAADACGAAVALRLGWALTGEIRDLDLVALGIVADIVSLRGENRDIVAHGLRQLAQCPRLGLRRLAQVARFRLDAVTAEDIAFKLAPRINAGGRMGDGQRGLELLLTDSADEAGSIAQSLDEANEERRRIETTIFEEAVAQLQETFNPEQRSIVLARRGWHSGVIGIVASRLQRLYYRPIVLVAFDGDGSGRGSARGIAGFDIISVLRACEEHLSKCGGHPAAAGIALCEEDLGAFQAAFEEEARRRLPPGELRPVLPIDATVSFSTIDGRLVKVLERLQPFGHGNPSPMFCTYGVRALPNSTRVLRGGHLRVTVQEGARAFTAVGFHMGDFLADGIPAGPLDIAYTPRFDTWRGETSIQLVLKDIGLSSAGEPVS